MSSEPPIVADEAENRPSRETNRSSSRTPCRRGREVFASGPWALPQDAFKQEHAGARESCLTLTPDPQSAAVLSSLVFRSG
jgi:hypothetical protein